MQIVSSDTKLNLSPYYLKPGFAFGGSCLPKDIKALNAWSKKNLITNPMLDHILESNQNQVMNVIDKILALNQKNIGIFGVAFKENTDDLRVSPMLELAEYLIKKGKRVRIYDSAISFEKIFGENLNFVVETITDFEDILIVDPKLVVRKSDAVVIARDFKELEWGEMPWRKSHKVLDLVGSKSLEGIKAEVDGLYW
jgi:GDP-mannose 6-dehydrogenase